MSTRSVQIGSLNILMATLLSANTFAALPKDGGDASAKIRPYVEGEVLVKYRRGIQDETSEGAVLTRHGSYRVRSMSTAATTLNRASRVQILDGKTVEDKVDEFRRDPDVVDAQPNFIYHLLKTPNNPKYAQEWGLKNTGQTVAGADFPGNPGTAGKDMNLEAAWDLITDCSSTTVAVIDTGINYNHEALKNNLWNGGTAYPNHGYNFVDSNTDPLDLNGHGTHVSGTIGASGNNGVGTTGVCWKSSIMALRVLDATGSGTTANITQAIDFAIAHGAKVMNMSLGGSGTDPAFEAALEAASTAGVVAVVAAGNDGANNDDASTPTFPCNSPAPNLVCVAALDQNFNLASFSNYGATSVDVGAPGTNILSSFTGTETVVSDSFHTGTGATAALDWTSTGGAWGYSSHTLTGQSGPVTEDMLTNPANWDGKTKTYATNLDARVYKSFNLAGYDSVSVGVAGFFDVAAADQFSVAAMPASGDPFGAGGTVLDQFNGSTNKSSTYLSYGLNSCKVANCSIGFRLTSGAATATTNFGTALFAFSVTGLTLNTNSYEVLDGTSMATPHITGLAAMLFAYNPNFTAADVVNAIKQGGTPNAALAGKSTSGNSANAYGSLTYIAPPSGVVAVDN